MFAPHRGRRVVLATNVAETSLTVPGIIGVVDPGTARISRYNRRTKVQRLPIEAISQASANQRAGRCGRVAPGTCIRLYSEEDFDGRPEFTEPEILRTNLASVILQMAALGLGDVAAFPFVEPPDARSHQGRHPAARGAAAPSTAARSATTCASRSSAAGWPASRSTLGWPAWSWRPTATAWWARCSCWRRRCRSRTRGSARRTRSRPHASTTSASPTRESDFLSFLNLWRYLREQQKARGSSQFRRMCQAEHLHHLRIREWQDVHSQLRQVARGMRLDVRPLAEEPDRDGIHRSLLAGLLSHIGMLDAEGNEYRGAREARFVHRARASALGKRRPKWVMAAELVETNRLRARTVAQITPDRIEQAAGHLVTRSHEEPWWEEARGAAMTTERVSLYGLPIVHRRRVQLDRVDPADARRMFLRHALVDGDWDGRHAFVQANKEQVADVVALEERVRRDLLVSDDALVGLLRRPGARRRHHRPALRPLVEGRACASARTSSPTPPTDLVEPGAGAVDLSRVPRRLAAGRCPPPAHLRARPRLRPRRRRRRRAAAPARPGRRRAGLDWQVPGRRHELVTALLRTLPKDLRRHHTPAPDVAAELLDAVGPDDGPLLDVLAASPRASAPAPRWPRTTSTWTPSRATCGSPTGRSTTPAARWRGATTSRRCAGGSPTACATRSPPRPPSTR